MSAASAVALDAMQTGWSGPPFDPFKLAEHLGISVVPREEVSDARIVQMSDGRFQIEYNPNRPRARVRYSIAHDLAHTLFPDCSEMVRHRLSRNEQQQDDWQLEMLCNIAAAEFLMPVGSFPTLKEEAADIDHLLTLRTRFDVSTEALLLRVVKLTEQPIAMFAASPLELRGEVRYQVDYAVFSRTWPSRLESGTLLPKHTTLAACTAIGFTSKGDDDWPESIGRVHVECVGIPPYPRQSYPRVVGVVRPQNEQPATGPKLTVVKGDATTPRGAGNRILAHVVNDKAALWGAGFGLAMRKRWPEAQTAFRDWVLKNSKLFKLGNTFTSELDEGLIAVQMICQRGYGISNQPRLRYAALQSCLQKLADEAVKRHASIHMPKIGTGEAGGSWFFIQQIIDELLVGRRLNVTVYELPDTGLATPQQSLFDRRI